MTDNDSLIRKNAELTAALQALKADAEDNLQAWTKDPAAILPGEPTGFCRTIIQKIDAVLPATPK